MGNVALACLPSLITGLFLAWFNRKQKKRTEREEEHAAARKQEALLSLELQNATAQLALASALARKRGHANGEVEAGVAAYKKADAAYQQFLQGQAVSNLQEAS